MSADEAPTLSSEMGTELWLAAIEDIEDLAAALESLQRRSTDKEIPYMIELLDRIKVWAMSLSTDSTVVESATNASADSAQSLSAAPSAAATGAQTASSASQDEDTSGRIRKEAKSPKKAWTDYNDPELASTAPPSEFKVPPEQTVYNDSLYSLDCREDILEALMAKESEFNSTLSYVIAVVVHPLKHNGILTASEWRRIFRNIDDIAVLSHDFLTILKGRFAHESFEGMILGDDLCALAHRLHAFNEFVATDSEAQAVLQQISWANPDLREFCDLFTSDAQVGSGGIPKWMQTVKSHIGSYAVLTKHLVRVTAQAHNDFDKLAKARTLLETRYHLTQVKAEEARMAMIVENARVKAIEVSLVNAKGEPVKVLNDGRRILKEADVRELVANSAGGGGCTRFKEVTHENSISIGQTMGQLVGKSKFKKRHIVLMNDMLLLTTQDGSSKKHKVLLYSELRNVRMVDHADSGDLMNAFEVAEKSDAKGHILCCATLTEKKAFTSAIRKLLKEYQDLAFRKEQLTKPAESGSSSPARKNAKDKKESSGFKRITRSITGKKDDKVSKSKKDKTKSTHSSTSPSAPPTASTSPPANRNTTTLTLSSTTGAASSAATTPHSRSRAPSSSLSESGPNTPHSQRDDEKNSEKDEPSTDIIVESGQEDQVEELETNSHQEQPLEENERKLTDAVSSWEGEAEALPLSDLSLLQPAGEAELQPAQQEEVTEAPDSARKTPVALLRKYSSGHIPKRSVVRSEVAEGDTTELSVAAEGEVPSEQVPDSPDEPIEVVEADGLSAADLALLTAGSDGTASPGFVSPRVDSTDDASFAAEPASPAAPVDEDPASDVAPPVAEPVLPDSAPLVDVEVTSDTTVASPPASQSEDIPPGAKAIRLRLAHQPEVLFTIGVEPSTTYGHLLEKASTFAGVSDSSSLQLRLETLILRERHLKFLQEGDIVDVIIQ